MTRKDKAERPEWVQRALETYCPRGAEIYGYRSHRTRAGFESWEYLSTDNGGIVKITLYLAKLLNVAIDKSHGGIKELGPDQLVYHAALKLYGDPKSLNLFKL